MGPDARGGRSRLPFVYLRMEGIPMAQMRAVVVDPESEGRLSVAEVDESELAPSEALVRVVAVSLNRSEIQRAQTGESGFRPAGTWPGP